MNGALLPDTVLPGNASGFTSTTSLAGISTTTYPALELSADLSTGSASSTPTLTSWTMTYLQGPIPLPGIAYSVAGAKSIGTDSASNPIIKNAIATSTGTTGVSSNVVEWDSYALTLPGYDITSACPAPPYSLAPAATIDSSLILSTSTGSSMLVSASDGTAPLAGASVTLSRTGFTKTVQSDVCGNAYFGNLSTASDYSLTGSKSGYTGYSATGVSVSGHVLTSIALTP